MRRVLLSSAVRIHEPPTPEAREAAALLGQSLTVYTPTDSEVRDGIAKVHRDLEDMHTAKYPGWTADWEAPESGLRPFTTGDGEVGVRGYLVVTRED